MLRPDRLHRSATRTVREPTRERSLVVERATEVQAPALARDASLDTTEGPSAPAPRADMPVIDAAANAARALRRTIAAEGAWLAQEAAAGRLRAADLSRELAWQARTGPMLAKCEARRREPAPLGQAGRGAASSAGSAPRSAEPSPASERRLIGPGLARTDVALAGEPEDARDSDVGPAARPFNERSRTA